MEMPLTLPFLPCYLKQTAVKKQITAGLSLVGSAAKGEPLGIWDSEFASLTAGVCWDGRKSLPAALTDFCHCRFMPALGKETQWGRLTQSCVWGR